MSVSMLGASLAFSQGGTRPSAHPWHERRDFYPEGVASGDPRPDSVLLWTRRPPVKGGGAAIDCRDRRGRSVCARRRDCTGAAD